MKSLIRSLKYSVLIAGLSVASLGVAQDDGAEMEASGDDIALQYQIDGGPKMMAEGSDTNPFQMVQEIFSKSAEAAKKKPGEKVTTTVDIPAPDELQGKLPPLTINTTVNADNTGRSDFMLPAFKQEVDGSMVNWEGLTGNFSFKDDFKSPDGKFAIRGFHIQDDEVDVTLKELSFAGTLDQYNEPLKVNVSLPMLKIVSEDANIVLQGLSGSADQKEVMEGLKTGPADFKIKNLVVNADGENVVVNDVLMEIITKLSGEFVDIDMNMGVDNVSIPANITPSTISTVSYSSNLQLRRVEAKHLAELQKTARGMQQQGMAQEMVGFAMMGKLMEVGPQLLMKSPEVNLSNLNLVTDKGNLSGHLKISYDGTKPLQFDQPAAMIGALIGDTEFTISKSLLEEVIAMQVAGEMPDDLTPEQKAQMPDPKEMANMQIQAFVGQGFLVQDGDNFKLTATLNGGQLMLNGQPMPLPF